MITHFFDVSMSHLSVGIMEAFVSELNLEQRIILCAHKKMLFGSLESERKKYNDVLEEYNFTNFEYIYDENAIFEQLFRELKKGNKCILHGYFDLLYPLRIGDFWLVFKILLNLSYFSNLIFVHWGVGDFKVISFTKKILLSLQRFIYSKLQYNIVLVDGDKDKLESFFNLRNIIVLPYFSTRKHIDKFYKFKEEADKKSQVRVVVSHSGHIHNNHKKTLDLLKSKFDSVISEVALPLCYGPKDYINEVIEYGKSLFGERFYYFTELLTKEKYVDFIRERDIFISAAENQTGLGASAFALGNGLKVFRVGLTYEDHKKNDFVVFHFDDLYNITNFEFCESLSEKQKKHNIYVLEKSSEIKIKKWNNLLSC